MEYWPKNKPVRKRILPTFTVVVGVSIRWSQTVKTSKLNPNQSPRKERGVVLGAAADQGLKETPFSHSISSVGSNCPV